MRRTEKLVRLDTYGFIPIPEEFMMALGWSYEEAVKVEIIPGEALILTKADLQFPVQRKEDS